MRYVRFFSLFLLCGIAVLGCSKNHYGSTDDRTNVPSCYNGKLVKKGPCGQLVVEVLTDKGNLQVAESWTDPGDGKAYRNVFTIANICDFTTPLEEGATFTFSTTTPQPPACIVCQAYTATPAERNAIQLGCEKK